MIIKLLVALARGGETLDAGQTINMNNARAEELIAEGYAEKMKLVDVISEIDNGLDEEPNGVDDAVPPVNENTEVEEDAVSPVNENAEVEDDAVSPVDENAEVEDDEVLPGDETPDDLKQATEGEPQNIPLGRSGKKKGGKK